MTIQPISAASVAVYFTPSDLRPYHVTPAGLTPELARRLTRTACREAGIALEGDMEIEAFPECCGVLVFARARPEGPVWFVFREVEDVLAAAVALRHAPPESALWWRRGKYWLSLSRDCPEAASVCAGFGSSAPPDPFRKQRLARTGRLIFPEDALFHLCGQFLGLHF